jgi:hypothetical protein
MFLKLPQFLELPHPTLVDRTYQIDVSNLPYFLEAIFFSPHATHPNVFETLPRTTLCLLHFPTLGIL